MPGQWGQKPGESDRTFKERKEEESRNDSHDYHQQVNTNVALVNNFGGILFVIIDLIGICFIKSIKVFFNSIKFINNFIDHALSKIIYKNYQRNIVLILIYASIAFISLYAVYLNNVFGFYSLNKLATTLKDDESFTLTIKKTTYKYFSHSYNYPETIKLIGINGPGKNKTIDVPKEVAATGMLNSEGKTPIDLFPEYVALIKQERADLPTVASAPKKITKKKKKHAEIAHKTDSDEVATLPLSKPKEDSSTDLKVTVSAPKPEVPATQDQ